MTKFSNSIREALQDAYPDHHWHPWLFPSTGNSKWWSDTNHQRQYVEWLAAKKLSFDPADLTKWYDVRPATFVKNNGIGLMVQYGYSVPAALMAIYPSTCQSCLHKGGPQLNVGDHLVCRSHLAALAILSNSKKLLG